jgi:hypothetical protein
MEMEGVVGERLEREGLKGFVLNLPKKQNI